MYHIISSDLIDIDFFLIYLNFSSKYNSIWGGIMTFQNMCWEIVSSTFLFHMCHNPFVEGRCDGESMRVDGGSVVLTAEVWELTADVWELTADVWEMTAEVWEFM